MTNIRRIYIFVVAAVSLHAVTWAFIALLRNLFTPNLNTGQPVNYQAEAIAWQSAVIIIGLPLYLAHWLWAQRLAAHDETEHTAVLRRVYLYVMMSAFLVPLIVNGAGFIQSALRLLFQVEVEVRPWEFYLSDSSNLVYTMVAMVVLAAVWAYHYWVTVADRSQITETAVLAAIHRLYMYLFSFAGVVMLSVGLGILLRWLLSQFGSNTTEINNEILTNGITITIVGLAVWLPFWRMAEKRFAFDSVGERTSALRKFYLYLIIFISALGAVGSLTIFLAGLFNQLLDVSSEGDIRNVLTVLVITALVWAYHLFVLQKDTRIMPEVELQAGIRRLYWYLIAGIGLLALLIGIGGNISMLIDTGGSLASDASKEQLSWFTAVTIAGLFVWIIPWRKIQEELNSEPPVGLLARQSFVRRIYLYFYLLVASLTFLITGISIVFEIIYLIMGGRTAANLMADLAQSLAFALMAVLVWIYHSLLLRRDNAALAAITTRLTQAVHLAIVDDEDGRFGATLIAAIHQAIPNAILHPIGLTPAANETLHTSEETMPVQEVLGKSQIIIGPWTIATPYVLHGETDLEMLAAVSASPAHKLLIPKPEEGWDWAGVSSWEADTAVKQTVRAVRRLIAGKSVSQKRKFLFSF